MSFGIAISDFIAIADKAYLVYKRCKDAPGKYADLTNRVLRLRDVLEDTKAYLVEADSKEQIPNNHFRLASLQAMCEGCNCTLDEVDNFLEKYANFGTETGTRRVISRLKFITSDADVLIKQLDLDASSLQLRLGSLTSLSVIHLQNAVERITNEYRTGARQPSVISHPKLDNKQVERQEMFEQISQDLEEKDIHPDSISLNKVFLDEWLAKVVEDGGLDEQDPVPPSGVEPTTTEKTANTAYEENYTDTEQQTASIDGTQATVADKVTAAGPNDDLYADPDGITTRPEDSITVIEANFMREGLASRSRSNSITSSTGKPENWHPYDRPSPAYVKEKLYALFHDDPTPEPVSGKTKHTIMRAFHQADYSDDGYLTRRTVIQHLSAALEDSVLQVSPDTLEGIVLSFDANRDGQFDDDEFLGLIQELMRRTTQERERQTEAKFTAIVQRAKVKARARREKDSKFFLHWGFSKIPGSTPEYFDDIIQKSVKTPPKVLEDSSFSVMAWEANICVDKISDFEGKWIGIVPKSLQSRFLDPLRNVQKIARGFILLENQNDRFALSDLDAFVTCVRLAAYWDQPRDIEDAKKTHSVLEAARLKCGFILDALLGFTETLERTEKFDASVHNFGKFQKWWKTHQIEWRSEMVSNECADWASVKDAISTSRARKLLPELQTIAQMVVEDFASREVRRVQIRRDELLGTPWKGYLSRASISGWSKSWVSKTIDVRKVYLRVSITNPDQILQTRPEKRSEYNRWSHIRDDSLYRVELLASSDITVEVMYQDNKRHDGILKYRFPAAKLNSVDFSKRIWSQGELEHSGPPCDVCLSFVLQDDSEFHAELKALEAKEWRCLLPQEGSVAGRQPNPFATSTRGPAPRYTP